MKNNKSYLERKKNRLMIPVGKFSSDTFVCNTCGARMFLKVWGDETPCRVDGCSGTMKRVK